MNKLYLAIGIAAAELVLITGGSYICYKRGYHKGRKAVMEDLTKPKDYICEKHSPSEEFRKCQDAAAEYVREEVKKSLNIQSPSHPVEDRGWRKRYPDLVDEDEQELSHEVAEEVSERTEHVNYVAPYSIPEKWCGSNSEFDQVNLFYYEDEGMVMDDQDALIDEDIVLGPHALEPFMNGSREDIYIRNIKLRTDFRVIWRDRYYQDGEDE